MTLNTINKIAFLTMEICFMPLISVIVPVYKAETYLDRCVKSILSQTITDLELILVEDGSPDRSGEICDDWMEKDSRVKVIHQKNAGAGAARNAGLVIARGDYIGFVDSDDWIHPQMYEILYNALNDKKCDVAICKMESRNKFNPNFDKITNFAVSTCTQQEMLEHFFRIHGEDSSIISVCIKLISKKVLKDFYFKVGTINEDVSASYYIIKHSSTEAMVTCTLYYYFQDPNGVTKSPVTSKDMEYISAYKEILDDVKMNNPMFEKYAYLNYIRSNFTILAKMNLFGYNKKDIQLCNKHKEIKQIVRRNFWILLKWPMPLSRKLLLLVVCL